VQTSGALSQSVNDRCNWHYDAICCDIYTRTREQLADRQPSGLRGLICRTEPINKQLVRLSDTRPHRRCARIVQTYSPAGADVTSEYLNNARFLSPARLYPAIVVSMGADLHGAMVATAPGEKLLIGRRPHVTNWARRTISTLICAENYLCS